MLEKHGSYTEIAKHVGRDVSSVWAWYEYKRKSKRTKIWVNFGCAHLDHTKINKELEILVRYCKATKPYGVVMAGDILDIGYMGKFADKDAKKKAGSSLAEDYKTLNALTESLSECCTELVYIEGNHESRIRTSTKEHPEITEGLIDIEHNIKNCTSVLTPWEDRHASVFMIAPTLGVTHGSHHGPTACQRQLKQSHFGSVIFHHTHRFGVYTDFHMGKVYAAFNDGCLTDLDPHYQRGQMRANEHGFGETCVFEDGSYQHSQIRILNGRFYHNGKLWS